MHKPSARSYIQTLLFIVPLAFIGYNFQRHETLALLVAVGFLFIAYAWVLKSFQIDDFKFWIGAAIIFRLLLLFATPSLSDDFYRFIWDGRLSANGIHPFIELPEFYLSSEFAVPGIDSTLFQKLNSKPYFTIYPPLAQAVFWLAAKITPSSIMGSVLVMRVLILLAELGSIYIMVKLIRHFGLQEKRVLFYALNPLVIIELTGNLHFEAFVIFFLLISFYFLSRSRIVAVGISMGFAVGAKLLPLIFLPLFLPRLGWKKALFLYVSAGITCALLFASILNVEVLSRFSQSIELYFNKFEFNASIYYLVREYGYLTSGYNIIQTVGWKLGLVAALLILMYSLFPYSVELQGGKLYSVKRFKGTFLASQLPEAMMWILCIYLFFATTVHPWYITTLLALSIFTNYRFVLLWSGLIFLTYAGYAEHSFTEILPLTLLEYLFVIGYLVYELLWRSKKSISVLS